jgi:hypothetical protein
MVRRADLLVTTAPHASYVEQLGAQLRKPVVVVTLRPEHMATILRQLRKGPVYFVGVDPRFETALCAIFEPSGAAEHVRAVILGRDDPSAIPADAPVYIMPSARERLGDTPVTARVPSAPRVFSDDTARELLTIIVRANITAMSARPS